MALSRCIAIAVACLLLAINCGCYYLGASIWSSPLVLLALVIGILLINVALSVGGTLCWPNVFILLLALFHLGYYVPVKLGLIDDFFFMPPVDSRSSTISMTLFAAGLVSLELGVMSGAIRFPRQRINQPLNNRDRHRKLVLYSGLFICTVSSLALFVYLVQVGGVRALFSMSYAAAYDFLADSDPRFAMSGMWFMPVGLLLTYVGLSLNFDSRGLRLWRVAAVAIFVIQIILGARGAAFLLLVGYLFFRNRLERRVRISTLVIVSLFLIFVGPLIAAYRNAGTSEKVDAIKAAQVTPFALALEMGTTYRPLYGFVDLLSRGSEKFFAGSTYLSAASQLFPNIGADSRRPTDDIHYRSNVWISEKLDPVSARRNIGVGSSAIAEPYANFGYMGVVLAFGLFGFGMSYLEGIAVIRRSALAYGMIAILFIPCGWYVRDDIYGTIRIAAWPAILLCAMVLIQNALRKNTNSLPVIGQAS